MISAKETGCFPYGSGQVCYIEVSPDGAVTQLSTVGEKRSAYINAQAGISKIFAVWRDVGAATSSSLTIWTLFPKSKVCSENTDNSAERRMARMKIFCLKGVPP